MALNVSLIYTDNTKSEKDLNRMIDHLSSVLKEIDGVEVTDVNLSKANGVICPYPKSGVLVFCGYDHLVLAYLNLALNDLPEDVKVVMYDEPGASIDRELNTLFFRGVDSGRMPSSSITRIIHSWSYRDILGIARQTLLQCAHGPGTAQTIGKPDQAKSLSGSRKGTNRTRQVENPGDPQASNRTGKHEAKQQKLPAVSNS